MQGISQGNEKRSAQVLVALVVKWAPGRHQSELGGIMVEIRDSSNLDGRYVSANGLAEKDGPPERITLRGKTPSALRRGFQEPHEVN